MKPVTEPILRAAANAFDFGGPVVCDARHYGEGHINDTFVVWREDHSKRFILQRINTDTFTDPVGLMENVCGVTRHLREKILAAGGDPARETLNVVPTLSGAACHLDAEGSAWRAYDFVEDTICLQQVGSEADFRTVAETLGKFQNQLADYPASTLHETIARFHDTPNRYANFEKALAADALGRAKDIAPEVAFIHAREKDCHVLLDLLAAGEIPLRVTHNDTKINNVLIDAAKQFVAYLYSDEACKLFAESGAIQPVLGIADDLEGDNKMFYSIYDNGAKAAMGNFAAFSAIPGVEVRTVFFDPVNSLVSGSMTEQQWIDGIKSASDQMRANIVE